MCFSLIKNSAREFPSRPALAARSFMRLIVSIVAAFAVLSHLSTARACGVCGCCRSDDPITLADPLNPFEIGKYERSQTAPLPGGVGASVDPIDPGSWTLVLMPDTQNYVKASGEQGVLTNVT